MCCALAYLLRCPYRQPVIILIAYKSLCRSAPPLPHSDHGFPHLAVGYLDVRAADAPVLPEPCGGLSEGQQLGCAVAGSRGAEGHVRYGSQCVRLQRIQRKQSHDQQQQASRALYNVHVGTSTATPTIRLPDSLLLWGLTLTKMAKRSRKTAAQLCMVQVMTTQIDRRDVGERRGPSLTTYGHG